MNRTWPVSPDRETLERRWREFLADPDPARRAELFPNPRSGRLVTTHVGRLPTLAGLDADVPPPPAVPYGWRPFDEQLTFEDPRLAGLERPSLWQSRSRHQLFLVFPSVALAPGPGPTVHCFTGVPDRNSFKGSASASIVALYRDGAATAPNITAGLLDTIGAQLRERDRGTEDPAPEDLVAYVYALLSSRVYQERFADELEGKTVRVPLTADPTLWADAVGLGSRLIWLHTSGQRFADLLGPEERLPRRDLGWTRPVTGLPKDASAIRYDDAAHVLHVGDGSIEGVRPDVWQYSVSGWPVVRRWLEHRTASGRGRRSSELDDIRPDRWLDSWNDDLLELLVVLTESCDLIGEQERLLTMICDGPLLAATRLPVPTDAERAVPATLRDSSSQGQLPD